MPKQQSKQYSGKLSVEEYSQIHAAMNHVLTLIKDKEIKDLYASMESSNGGDMRRFVFDVEWNQE